MRRCFECDAPATAEHHVIPKSRGGTRTIPLCDACHGLVHGVEWGNDSSVLIKEGLHRARERGVKLGRPSKVRETVVRRIHEMRRIGLSYPQIAAALNESGEPTSQGGACWHASTVRHVHLRVSADPSITDAVRTKRGVVLKAEPERQVTIEDLCAAVRDRRRLDV